MTKKKMTFMPKRAESSKEQLTTTITSKKMDAFKPISVSSNVQSFSNKDDMRAKHQLEEPTYSNEIPFPWGGSLPP